jgi:acyl-coenzyme A synthetase/AMP-(fatty) acid ligase
MTLLPLVCPDALQRPLLLSKSNSLSFSEVLYRSRKLADTLPDMTFCILCSEGLDHFIYGWLAALMRGQTLLLPPSRAPVVVEEIHKRYPESYCLNKVQDDVPGVPGLASHWLEDLDGTDAGLVQLPESHLAAVVFTSGSTGQPEPNRKYWGDLVRGSRALQLRLGITADSRILATVPAQHMYGLETSVLAPLLTGASVHAEPLFFPADIHQSVAGFPAPPVLVTTPLHLRTLVNAELEWPPLQMLLSATAPLERRLARAAEACFQAPVMEVFGCSEAGSFSSRRTARETDWQLYDTVSMRQDGDSISIKADYLPVPVRLSDRLERKGNRHFRFLGRQQDMIKVAGKRISLVELNHRLLQVPGVVDGVFLLQAPGADSNQRLMALVVAPDTPADGIRRKLAELIDPVFLPRPLRKVEMLPRTAAGKLPRAALEALLEELGS